LIVKPLDYINNSYKLKNKKNGIFSKDLREKGGRERGVK